MLKHDVVELNPSVGEALVDPMQEVITTSSSWFMRMEIKGKQIGVETAVMTKSYQKCLTYYTSLNQVWHQRKSLRRQLLQKERILTSL